MKKHYFNIGIFDLWNYHVKLINIVNSNIFTMIFLERNPRLNFIIYNSAHITYVSVVTVIMFLHWIPIVRNTFMNWDRVKERFEQRHWKFVSNLYGRHSLLIISLIFTEEPIHLTTILWSFFSFILCLPLLISSHLHLYVSIFSKIWSANN